MLDVTPHLYRNLHFTMLKCGPFNSDALLRAAFNDARIAPWYHQIPEAKSPQERVTLLIDLLQHQHNAAGENALLLFLYVLRDQQHPQNACHRELTNLIKDIEATMRESGSQDTALPCEPSPPPAPGGVHISIGGNANGQIAFGSNIVQTQTIRAEPSQSGEKWEHLKARVLKEASETKRPPALERLQELKKAMAAHPPDMLTINYVKRWVAEHLPGIVEDVLRVIESGSGTEIEGC